MSPPPPRVQRGLPGNSHSLVDHCWNVPLLAAISTFLITLPSAYMGILFVFFVEDYNISRERASWPENVLTMCIHLSGLFVGLLQRRMAITNIIVLGSVLASTALIASAFTRNVVGFSIAIGVMYGLGLGSFTTSVAIYIMTLFDKLKGTALSLTFGAWGIAGFFAPAVLTKLRTVYALDGTLLMTGAIVLHAIPLSILLRYPRPINVGYFKNIITSWSAQKPADSPKCAEKVSIPIHELSASRLRAISTLTPSEPWKIDKEVRAQGTFGKGNVPEESRPKGHVSNPQETPQKSLKVGISRAVQRLSSAAATVFKTPAFYVFMVATVVGDYSMVAVGTTLIDYAVDHGVNVDDATKLASLGAIGQLFGRLFLMPLADWAPIIRLPCFAGSFTLAAICTLIMPHATSFGHIITLQIFVTTAQGFIVSVRSLLLAEYLGIERLATCVGLYGIILVPVSLCSPSIVGFFRDKKGSYDAFYRMLAGLNSGVAVVICGFIVFNFIRAKRQRAANTDKAPAQLQAPRSRGNLAAAQLA